MRPSRHRVSKWRGMSLMDVIVGTAIMLIVFLALTTLLRTSLAITAVAKDKAIATSVAESQMEYVRSLNYDAVGTVGGIPSGNIPQYATTTENNINFQTRTYIEYVDDPADGLEAADTNGITTDYKRIKVSVNYTVNNVRRVVDLVSNYAPPGLETSTGGGTLRINVVNAAGSPVPGASVRVKNASVSPAIDVTTFSNASGVVYLPGAATSTQYEIYVTKNGYSSAQTYLRDATNQNPSPGYLTVVKNQTTTATFPIDLLATLAIHTYAPIATTTWMDDFSDSSKLAAQSNATVSGSALVLATDANGYVGSGTARSVAVVPDYLAGWSSAVVTTTLPAGTSARFHVADASGTLLPDSVLTGNSAGFTDSVDLSGVPVTTYPKLSLTADLSTGSPLASPAIQDWVITYRRGPIPLPNIAYSLTGQKTTGSTGAGAPLYKTTVSASTDATGTKTQTLEWDVYRLTLSGYDVTDACNAPPYTLAPGSSLDASVTLGASTANMLLISVRGGGAAVPGASVTLSRTGFTKTVTASTCGTAYFGNVPPANDYTISATASGYTPFSATGVSVSGQSFYAALFD